MIFRYFELGVYEPLLKVFCLPKYFPTAYAVYELRVEYA